MKRIIEHALYPIESNLRQAYLAPLPDEQPSEFQNLLSRLAATVEQRQQTGSMQREASC